MSYEEYFDLYLLAQEKKDAPYHMVSFDVVNCKLMTDQECVLMHKNIDVIMRYVYSKLLESEKKLKKQVVIKDERFFQPWKVKYFQYDWNFMDPFLFGDCFQFTVLRDTVSKEQITKWVNECKEKLNMKEEFHIADGYYETNEYAEGGTRFYRGYCMQTLETLHKKRVQKELKKVRKRINLNQQAEEAPQVKKLVRERKQKKEDQ